MEVRFENAQLEEAYRVSKQRGYKCYGFQKDVAITQFFFVNSEDKIGTVQARWGGICLSTVHVPNKKYGTGFGLNGLHGFASPEDIDQAFATTPEWAIRGVVKKYKNWDEYISTPLNKILNYFEI